MPELPEVETVKNGLLKKVKGRTIIKCDVTYKGIIAYPEVSLFEKELTNQKILDIERRGKFLIFRLNDYYLTSHLRMEGKYFIRKSLDELNKHDHVIFYLDNNELLCYNDTRKFGKMHLVKTDELNKTPLNDLGKEPWDKDLNITYLKDKLNKKKAIKTLLLDQSIISGIGNIYADEILFLSKINPNIKGEDLTDNNLTDIIAYTKEILEKAIAKGGTTIHTYTSVDGTTGLFQQELLVHGKNHQSCPICHQEIIKTVVNTRGTYYCPNCQKEIRK